MEEPGSFVSFAKLYIFFFLVNRGRRRSEMKARSTEDRRSRIPLRRISSLFFFFRRIFPFIVYYYAYLSLGAGQLPPNLASFVRSLNEIPPHVPIARNGEDWIVLHNGLDSIKGERKRRFCNFHIR